MSPRCTALTSTGKPCGMAPLKSTRPGSTSTLCWNHSITPALTASRQKGAKRLHEKLRAARAKLTVAKTKAIAEFGLDPSLAEHLDNVADLKRWGPYVATLILTGKVTPAGAQALLGCGRLARETMALEGDIKLAETLDELKGDDT